MKIIEFGISRICSEGPAYFIAEIGHNHQGKLPTALEMIKKAAECGVQAVKFQKRDNKTLYTTRYYERPYDNENSYGATYGAHREYLEFGWNEYAELMKCAEDSKVEFMCTPFDMPSVAFLEKLGITSYKIASADLTNTILLKEVARTGKPMFVSTGASALDEVKRAYEEILRYHDLVCFMHCTAGYPTEYKDLNLRVLATLKRELPQAVVGYSGHDNGILAPIIAYLMGAVVIEKHFTLNHAWKGTDHKFSLEPEGLRKQVRDLRRVDEAAGNPEKMVYDFEKAAREKMGKSIYAARDLSVGEMLSVADVCIKSPGGGLPPYRIEEVVGKKLKAALKEEDMIISDLLE